MGNYLVILTGDQLIIRGRGSDLYKYWYMGEVFLEESWELGHHAFCKFSTKRFC